MNPNDEVNPYAAPATLDPASQNANTSAVAVRKVHLSHEASVKSFGFLYYIGAVIMMIAGTLAISGALFHGMDLPQGQLVTGILGGLYFLFGSLQFWIGRGLRSLNQVGKVGGTIFGAIGLIGFPVGTILSGYLLYLLWSRKGAMVFSDRYKEIIAETPEIKYKTSIIVWVFLGLLVLAFLIMFVGLLLTAR